MSNWKSKYTDNKVNLKIIQVDNSWKTLFDILMEDDKITKLEKSFSVILKKISEVKNEKINIYPHPDNIFYAFNMTKYENVKVVILGQD